MHKTKQLNKIKMKQLFKSIAAIALVATFFTSCSKDSTSTTTTGSGEVGAPTLTLTTPTSESNLRFNDVLTLKFTSSPASGAKLKSVLVTRTNTISSITVPVYGDSTASLADSATINRTVADTVFTSIGNVGDKLIYTITVTDDKGKSATTTAVLNIKDLYSTGQFIIGAPQSTTTEIKFFGFQENAKNGVQLYKAGVANMGAGEQPSTADSATRARFNSDKIDMAFFFGTTNQNGLYSPTYDFGAGNGWYSEYTFWAKRNNTIFIDPLITKITSSQFSATNFNVEQIIDGIDYTKNNLNFVRALDKDNVVAFKTESGAKGLILIVSEATDAKSFATFAVKYKK